MTSRLDQRRLNVAKWGGEFPNLGEDVVQFGIGKKRMTEKGGQNAYFAFCISFHQPFSPKCLFLLTEIVYLS
jgi:hypothetical protein